MSYILYQTRAHRRPLQSTSVSFPSASYLDQYAAGYYTARGYTEALAFDWSTFANTAAVLAAISFGSSSGSNVPRTAYVTKINDDPIFPNRMIESLFPYNNDVPDTGAGSYGRQFVKTFNWTGANRTWRRWVERYGGTQHPVRPSASNFTQNGAAPAGGDGQKEIFWAGPFTRIGQERVGNTRTVGADWGFSATETKLTEPGIPDLFPGGVIADGSFRDGKEVFQFIEDFYVVSSTVCILRSYRQVLTLNGLWNPQPLEFAGFVYTNPIGGTFGAATGWTWRLNKNKTNADDGLSTVSWDTTDIFKSTNQDANNGLVARAENTKPWRGVRTYEGPWTAITGGDNKPFVDLRTGQNLDDLGRGDADWPVGA